MTAEHDLSSLDLPSAEDEQGVGRTALDLALSQLWLMQPDALKVLLSIAARSQEQVEALVTTAGRPLDNTRTVTVRDGVALVPVNGPIFQRANLFTRISGATSGEILGLDLTRAASDPSVRGIVLDIDSPGGQAGGISELAEHVRALTKVKPIVAYVRHLGASAAYWLAAATDSVVISDTALVGSIGTVLSAQRGRDSKQIEFVSSVSPAKRPDLESEAGRAQLQRLVDDLGMVFVESVARYRGVSPEDVIERYGKGDVLVGARAVSAGLADKLGSLESVIAGIAGNSRRGSFMTNTTTGAQAPEITRDFIAHAHPAVFQAIRAEGIEIGVADAKRQREEAVEAARVLAYEEGRSDGLQAEAKRIREIEALAIPGDRAVEAVIQAAKADPNVTADNAARQVIEAVREQKAGRIVALRADAPQAVPVADVQPSAVQSATDVPDFDALVQEKIDSGMSRAQAVSAVVHENPASHEAYLARHRAASGRR